MRFKDNVVVILGGNSGIGLASAIAFAAEGAKVIVTGRNRDTLDKAADAIGHGALAIQSDIADVSALGDLFSRIGDLYGKLDVLFVNAGIGEFIPVEQTTEESYDRMMGINLRGPYFAVQKALPLMSGGGAIVLTSSLGHVKGIAGNSVYAAAKAGLRALARNFGAELVERGIRVNCISPGPIDTPLLHRSGIPDEEIPAVRRMIEEKVPMKRFGTSDEAARAVLFLASRDSAFITGIDLFVDGGAASF